MIINSNNLKEMIIWNQIQYFALPFISVLWFVVALLYTKTIYKLNKRTVIVLFFIPVVTFLIKNTSLKEAEKMAEKLRDIVLNTKVVYEDKELSFTVSIGIATLVSDNSKDIEDILKQADDALYRGKAMGRNCIVTVDLEGTVWETT